MNQAYSNNFEQLRQSVKLSVAEAADFLNLTEDDIKDFDAGLKQPTVSKILALQGLKLATSPNEG